jgi:hypothetical protein
METWATFSIIDHRHPVYRQALALFDKIIVPIPPMPIGNQTAAELQQLESEVEYLAGEGAAQRFDWSSDAFQDWRAPFLAEAVSAKLNRDAFGDSRLMMSEKLTSESVQAIPVYGGVEQHHHALNTLMAVEKALTLEILQRLPVPEFDTPLENLVRLRAKPAFRRALDDLLEWKRDRVPGIFLAPKRDEALTIAIREFDKLTEAYAKAMESAGFAKLGQVSSIFISLATGDIAGVIKEGLVSAREIKEPSWKKLSDLKCAPGGVVYHFKEAMM